MRGLIRSPLKGPAGNIEFLAWLAYGDERVSAPDVEAFIDRTLDDSAADALLD